MLQTCLPPSIYFLSLSCPLYLCSAAVTTDKKEEKKTKKSADHTPSLACLQAFRSLLPLGCALRPQLWSFTGLYQRKCAGTLNKTTNPPRERNDKKNPYEFSFTKYLNLFECRFQGFWLGVVRVPFFSLHKLVIFSR